MNYRLIFFFIFALFLIPEFSNAMGVKRISQVKASDKALLNETNIGPVPHPAVQNQGDVGFCWAYAMSAYIESMAERQGKTAIISPEYLALNHTYLMLKKTLPTLVDQTTGIEKNSNFINSINMGGSNFSEALFELQDTGVVPETFFKHKFPYKTDKNGKTVRNLFGKTQELHPTFKERVTGFIKQSLKNNEQISFYEQNPDSLKKDLASAIGINIPDPTDTFSYDGENYNALTFMKDYLGFEPNDYSESTIASYNPFDSKAQAMETIESTIRDGIPVPLSFVIYSDYKLAKKTGVFTPGNCRKDQCKAVGGHAVLIVGLKEESQGAINSFTIENSWGLMGLDDAGHEIVDPSKKGFFEITTDYLSQSSQDALPFSGWTYLVPKKYLPPGY